MVAKSNLSKFFEVPQGVVLYPGFKEAEILVCRLKRKVFGLFGL